MGLEFKGTGETKEKDKNKSGIDVISVNFSVGTMLSSEHFQYDTRAGVIKWGKDNLLPDYLIMVAQIKSSKHSAVIRRKVKMIAGQGWQTPQSEEAKAFLQNAHGNKPMNKIARLNQFDWRVLESFALGIRWNIDKTVIAAIDYIPMRKVRATNTLGVWKISENWSRPNSSGSNTQIKQQFNTNPLPDDFENLTDKQKKYHLNQIYVFQGSDQSAEAYPLPEYASGMDWILSDAGISSFTLNMIKKNFTGGYHINISTGIPESDERKEFKKDFKKEYAGENGESIIITFSEPESQNVPTMTALPSTGNEDIYENTEKRASENIFICHEVTNPQLFGIRVPGELGGRSDLLDSLEIFQSVYISPIQKEYEEIINTFARVNGITEELKLNTFSLESSDNTNATIDNFLRKFKKLPDMLKQKVTDTLEEDFLRSLVDLPKKEKNVV